MIQVVENCLQLRGRVVHNYALLESDQITLIDGGFLSNSPERVIDRLRSLDLDPANIKTILLTHGHIDHTLNLSRWRQLTDAQILAPQADSQHIDGSYPYRGASRVCGCFEFAARKLLNYTPPSVDRWIEPGTILPVWGGLEVIALPGHTLGHVGFYSSSRKLLFAGDLFSNFFHAPKLPPRWFNVDREKLIKSIECALALDVSGGVLLSHCHPGTPQEHRQDLEHIAGQLGVL